MSSTTSATPPITIHSYILTFRLTDLASKQVQATAGLLLRRSSITTSVLRLNARGLSIASVCVNEQETTFRVRDYLAKLVGDKVNKDLQTLSACLTGDVDGATEGEFEIDVPTSCMQDEILAVEIEYTVNDNGLVFALLDANSTPPHKDAHAYTRNGFCHAADLGAGCGARTWFPCIDTIQAIATYKIQIEVLPSHICIATGALITKRPLPHSVVYEFEQTDPIPPYAVGFVVGPFLKSSITSQAPYLTTYVLSSRQHLLQRYESTLGKQFFPALAHLESYVSETPAKHAQVFVAREYTHDLCMPFATMSILSDEILLGSYGKSSSAREVNPPSSFLQYSTKMEETETSLLWRLVGVASSQWFGSNRVFPCTVADVWIPVGLALFCTLEALRATLGEASYHSILARWTRRVTDGEHRASQVLFHAIYKKPGFAMARSLSRPKPYALPVDAVLWSARGISLDSFFACKAALVVRMIEQRMTGKIFKECVRRLVKRQHFVTETAFLTALKARDPINTRDITYAFISQWLRHSGIPKFKGVVEYNAKNNRVQVTLQQVVNPGGRVYMGAIKVRVVETGGTWEYEKQIDNVEHRWSFECRSKKSALQRKRGRKSGEEERRAIDVERWREPDKLQTIELLNFALKTTHQQWWENDSSVRYVLLDPDRAWIMDLEWTQPEAFWLELLNEGSTVNSNSDSKKAAPNVAMMTFAMDQVAAGRVIKNVGGTKELSRENIRLAAVLASEFFRKSIHTPYCRRYACEALLRWHEAHDRKSAHACSLFVEIYKSLFMSPGGDTHPLDYTRKGEQVIRPFSLHVLARFCNQNGFPSESVKELVLDAIRKYDSKEEDDSAYRCGMVRAAAELAVAVKHQSIQAMNPANFLAAATTMTSSSSSLDAEVDELVKHVQHVMDLSVIAAESRRVEAGEGDGGEVFGGDDFHAADDDDQQPLPDARPELACLDALCLLEMKGVIPFRTTKFASFVEDPRWSRDPAARLTGFSCVLKLCVIHRSVKGAQWMQVVHWLFRQIANDACARSRVEMMKLMLTAHADTVSSLVPELGDGQETSTAGCFWPLMQPEEDMKEIGELEQAKAVAQAVWDLINHKSSFQSQLRVLAHQFWRMIWQFDPIPFWPDAQMVIPELGELENWVDLAEKAFMLDEQKTMIKLEDVNMMRKKQAEIVDEKERAKKERLDEVLATMPASTTTTTTTTTVANDGAAAVMDLIDSDNEGGDGGRAVMDELDDL